MRTLPPIALIAVVALALTGCAQEYQRQQVAGMYTVLDPEQIDRNELVDSMVPTPTQIPGVESDIAGGFTTMRINRFEFQRDTGHRWPSNERIVASYSQPGLVSANPQFTQLVTTIQRLHRLIATAAADDLTNAERAQILAALRGATASFNRLALQDAAFSAASAIDATSPIWALTQGSLDEVRIAAEAFASSREVAVLTEVSGAEPVSFGKAIAWLLEAHRGHRPSEVMSAIRLASVHLDRWENHHVDLLAGATLTAEQRGTLFMTILRLRTAILQLGTTWGMNFHRIERAADLDVVGPVQMAYP